MRAAYARSREARKSIFDDEASLNGDIQHLGASDPYLGIGFVMDDISGPQNPISVFQVQRVLLKVSVDLHPFDDPFHPVGDRVGADGHRDAAVPAVLEEGDECRIRFYARFETGPLRFPDIGSDFLYAQIDTMFFLEDGTHLCEGFVRPAIAIVFALGDPNLPFAEKFPQGLLDDWCGMGDNTIEIEEHGSVGKGHGDMVSAFPGVSNRAALKSFALSSFGV